MPAQFLLGLFNAVYLLALAAWVGSTLFFSFGVAPLIFRVLGTEHAGRFVRALFPRYYAWGAISGALALPALVAVPLCYPEYRGPGIAVQALIIVVGVLIMLYAANSLTPAMSTARDSGAEGQTAFKRLLRRSMILNALVLAAGIGLLAAFANRPAPRTSGIPELSAVERMRFDAELDRVIEQVEIKYGYRRGNPGQSPAAIEPGSMVDTATIREIESYYEQKKQRDMARKGMSSPAPQPGLSRTGDEAPAARPTGGPGG